MRFSTVAVLAAVAPLATNGFTTPLSSVHNIRQNFVVASTLTASKYDLDLGDEFKAVKKTAATPAPVPAPVPASKPGKGGKATPTVVPPPPPAAATTPTKFEKRGPKKVEAAPAPASVVSSSSSKAKKAAKVVVAPPPPPVKVTPTKPTKVVSTVTADPNAVPAGVALGVTPLLLVPIVALGAGRSVLAGTKARREKIQKEIEDFEAAKRKKKVQSEVDGGALTQALVRCI
jgi:hypothetical protein